LANSNIPQAFEFENKRKILPWGHFGGCWLLLYMTKSWMVLHTMLVNWADRGLKQFDWSKAEVCPLGVQTKGQQPIDNALQSIYMATLFVSFDAKSLYSKESLCNTRMEIKTPLKWINSYFSKIIQTPQFVYFNGLLLLGGNLS
jgi:hypothetical protein